MTLGAVLLVLSIILVRFAPLTLYGTDGACYARIAADLAKRPLSTWADVQWMDGTFYEHPPLGLWMEGLWFKIFGSTAAAAVWLARVYTALLAFVVWWTARALTGHAQAAYSLFGLAALASFQRETQNPMLEAPLMLACAIGLACCVRLPDSRRWVVGFALATTAALWIKGVVALALGVGVIWAWWRGASWRRALAALALTGAMVGVSAAAFETLRSSQGLPPYLDQYLRKQVLVAFLRGRHNVEPNPWFHLGTLVTWHLPMLVALPVLALRWRRQSQPGKQLAVLGLAWIAAVLVPLSMATQKSDWHLNVIIPGAAWVVGAALAALPERVLRFMPLALVAAIAGWWVMESRGIPADNARQWAIVAVTTTPASLDGAHVSNCSPIAPWLAQHLFAFHWNGTPVACEEPAPWRFDGVTLKRQ